MPIERPAPKVLPKRLISELTEKIEKIGELLDLEVVPTHQLAWKEVRMNTSTGDCYPVIDFRLAVAIKLRDLAEKVEALQNMSPSTVKRTRKKNLDE